MPPAIRALAAPLLPTLAFTAAVALAVAPVQAAVKAQEVVAKSGVKAWLVEDHTNPIVSVTFIFRAGGAYDPAGKEGAAKMISVLLDEGAGDIKALAFQKRLEDLSISLSFDVGRDSFRGTMRTLTRNRDEAFRLLALALTKPRFDADAVDRMRAQLTAGAVRRSRSPGYIAQRTWWRAAFPGHPYGRPVDGTEASLAAITAEDLRRHLKASFARDNLYIGVVGDITAAELAALLDRTFGGLPAKAQIGLVAPAQPRVSGKVVVKRLGVPQAVAIFGHAGIPRKDKDFYAAYVLNHVLGGGSFSSRLYDEVREKRGLAYSVYSYLWPMDKAALFLGGVATQNARVAKSVQVIRDQWRRMADRGVSPAELAAAKKYLTGSYALRFSSSGRIASMLAALQLEHLSIDYFQKRNAYIRAVTVAQIKRVARRLLKAKDLTFVVVGDPAGL